MSEAQDLNDIANFIILISTGALIPLFLVIYKSRCKSICWGCIERKVIGDDSDEEQPRPPPLPTPPAQAPDPETASQGRASQDNQNP